MENGRPVPCGDGGLLSSVRRLRDCGTIGHSYRFQPAMWEPLRFRRENASYLDGKAFLAISPLRGRIPLSRDSSPTVEMTSPWRHGEKQTNLRRANAGSVSSQNSSRLGTNLVVSCADEHFIGKHPVRHRPVGAPPASLTVYYVLSDSRNPIDRGITNTNNGLGGARKTIVEL